MAKGPNQGRSSRSAAAHSAQGPGGRKIQRTVEAFASQVLSVVAANNQATRGASVRVFRQDLMEALSLAVMAYESTARDTVLGRFRAAGISDAEIIDDYLPAVARKLGAAWCEDEMSFADVTIGSARLQAMLRDIRAAQVSDPKAPSILVAVPRDAYHTLGAGVLADQLRRLGVAPRMALGLSLLDLSELIETHDFNAVMISAASSEKLETVRDMINRVRRASHTRIPVVLGGTILDNDTDVKTLTGADYVTNNPKEALRACGLMIKARAVELPGTRD